MGTGVSFETTGERITRAWKLMRGGQKEEASRLLQFSQILEDDEEEKKLDEDVKKGKTRVYAGRVYTWE